MTTINLTPEQKSKLSQSALRLFKQGTPSLRFMRILHNDYQIVCNDDLNSPDDFYNMKRQENKPMLSLLNCIGFNYTVFGIVLNH